MSQIAGSDQMDVTVSTNADNKPAVTADSVKDSGRVRVGAGFMPFGSTKDAGRVIVGAGFLRF